MAESKIAAIPKYIKFAGSNTTNDNGIIFFDGYVPVGKMVATVRFPNAMGKPFMMYESATYSTGAKIYSDATATAPYALKTVSFEGYYLE